LILVRSSLQKLLNFSLISISSIHAVWNGRAASLSGQALRGGLPNHPASKRIVRANNRSITAKSAGSIISTILLGEWARQAGRT
jgi:hypothetical protein